MKRNRKNKINELLMKKKKISVLNIIISFTPNMGIMFKKLIKHAIDSSNEEKLSK